MCNIFETRAKLFELLLKSDNDLYVPMKMKQSTELRSWYARCQKSSFLYISNITTLTVLSKLDSRWFEACLMLRGIVRQAIRGCMLIIFELLLMT